MGKYKSLFSNTVVFAISNILSKLVLSALLPLFTRFLTTGEYGTAELLTTISQLIIPICSLSIQDAVFRFSIDKQEARENVIKAVSIFLSGPVVILIILSFIARWYEPISKWTLVFLAISILSMVRSILSLYVKASNKVILFSADSVLYNIVLAGSNVFFLIYANLKLWGYFFAIIIANSISIIFLIIFGRIYRDIFSGHYDFSLLKRMLVYSSPLVVNSISWSITNLTDKVMLERCLSTSAVGIYSAASKIPTLLSLITNVFAQAWTISLIQDYQTDKDSKFYKNIFMLNHFAIIAATLVILMFNNNVILLVLGNAFSESVRYVPVLLIGTVFLAYSNFCSPIYSALKLSKHIMYTSLCGAIVNVILNFVLIPLLGVMGACIATAVSYMVIAIIRLIESNRLIGIDYSKFKFIVSCVLITSAGFLVTIQRFEVISSLICGMLFILMYFQDIRQYIGNIAKYVRLRGNSK